MKQFLSLLIGLHLSISGHCQSPATYNLRPDWNVQEKESFVKYTGQKSKAIHFTLDKKSQGSRLLIFDRAEYSVFINGKLIATKRDSLQLRVDSLRAQYRGSIFISIYQKRPIYSLKTMLLLPVDKSDFENPVREGNYFNDFVIVASFILMALMVILFRVNPRLTFDYLNVVKLFSFQERDEAIVAGRIGSSINLFFFALISFLLSLLLIIIFYVAPDRIRMAAEFVPRSTLHAFISWFILSCIIFLVLIAKLVLIASFSLLFNVKSTVRFQFFNFIRLLFVTSLAMGLIATIYFIFHSQNPALFYNLLIVGSLFVAAGTIFLFLKLLARTAFPVFHLFSYLCATEIVPLMILGKVILF
jgi:Domain of unknown function (DUF4271)